MIAPPARPTNLTAVSRLLAACDLPHTDLTEAHLAHFIVEEDDGRLAGVVGLEPYGDAGLLRSLAVAPSARGRGLGGRLVDALEADARKRGLRRLYLLTTTAEAFFAHRGYTVEDRARVPEAIRGTTEFAALCPSTAVCMKKNLADEAS